MRARQGGQEAACCNLHPGEKCCQPWWQTKGELLFPHFWPGREGVCWETSSWQLRLGAERLLWLCCHCIAAVSRGGPACCSTEETGCFSTRLGPGNLLKQPRGASAFPAAGHRGDAHPAAVCPVGELLSLPQAGAGVSGGYIVLGFCLLKRRKHEET